MKYRTIGMNPKTSREVSVLALGTHLFGTVTGEATSFALLDRYVQAGGTFIDTAGNYAFWVNGTQGGESEELLGRWRRSRGASEEIVIATKLGARPQAPGTSFTDNAEGLSAKVIREPSQRSRDGVVHPEPAAHHLGDPDQRPALILIPALHGRADVQHRLQLTHLGRGQLAPRTARPLRRQRLPAAGGQRPPPPVRRHPRHPEPLRHLPVAGPRLDQLGRRQPPLLPAGPLGRGQPAAIGGYLMPPAYRAAPAVTSLASGIQHSRAISALVISSSL
jgi:hypothetical protein